MVRRIIFLLVIVFHFSACSAKLISDNHIKVGASSFQEYIPLIKDKRVGLLVNHSSLVQGVHLLDTLIAQDINVVKIFAPEHGFRGKKDAGEHVANDMDQKTGLPIVSLYGKNRKPSVEMLQDLDVVVFDIQDVGVRFYTYISTMHYMMEACAKSSVKFIVLDRPNPNGDYFDGPVLDKKYQSFVGMHPIPIVHGLTVGELAQMINGEGWLENQTHCDLTVIKMKNWDHKMSYDLPVKPSPNLPNYLSVRLYPSLCFFEATNISIGRGTYFPFQVIGYPDSSLGSFSFTPRSIDGMSKTPKQKDQVCYGVDLRSESLKHQFSLKYFLQFYNTLKANDGFKFDVKWFNLLAGKSQLSEDIINGLSEQEIRAKWAVDLKKYSLLRDKYLLYSKEE
ncbi:exo-beta-N-acetylmuramidase NamZ family protein [Plebeiibacterium sediminum]|uniref:DUF1343 domain-containing protein n=1 Tax=Plebeiibacterium sediminum TaxID=2992112 RepID=A0AAE3SEN6_9BACT|nr:DUF1343 domain-containing protein [Plebeiobacterium sediminum]MCW3786197.1 DUF1343 domain-containing protein [Plebeiobacterium sediminum]